MDNIQPRLTLRSSLTGELRKLILVGNYQKNPDKGTGLD